MATRPGDKNPRCAFGRWQELELPNAPKESKQGPEEGPKTEEDEKSTRAKEEGPKFGPPIPGSQTSLGGRARCMEYGVGGVLDDSDWSLPGLINEIIAPRAAGRFHG